MIKRALLPVCAGFLAAGTLFADFSYDQSSKITGGMMAGAMKVIGVFSKQATQPIKSTVMVKGDRMAHVGAETVQVIDLAKETITDINLKNKTYSVMTFAQMVQAMDQAAQKAAAQPDSKKAEVNFKASVKETGQTKVISGLNTREVILTLVMENTDKESGNKGAMNVVSDMWLAPDVPGYSEVRAFYQRMGAKLSWTPGTSAFTQGRGDMAKAFGDLSKESAKLEGVPVMQVVSMGGVAAEGQQGQPPAAQQSQKEEQREPTSIGGALGRLGGLGGLGRKKQEPPPKQEQQSTASAPGTLLEMTTETMNFSGGPVDASKFEVPASFKQVQNDLVKNLK
jgi:carbon monoxide dehydrogenase subunit G